MIVWDESFDTGVESIDKQHYVLIEKFNELEYAVETGQTREKTGEILDFLQFYIEWHFEREEACMHEVACPAATRNKEAHRFFAEEFNNLYNAYYEHSLDGALFAETVEFLSEWIVKHIKKIDTGLRQCAVAYS